MAYISCNYVYIVFVCGSAVIYIWIQVIDYLTIKTLDIKIIVLRYLKLLD